MSLEVLSAPLRKAALLVLAGVLVAGCASPSRAPAPVVDRSSGVRTAPAPAPVAPGVVTAPVATPMEQPPRVLPGAENAGRPGYYTVQRGDTLIRIALDNGQNWRDLVRWNNLENPNLIEVGQVLRVTAPGSDTVVARAVPAPTMPTPTPAPSAAAVPASGASAPVAGAPAAAPGTGAPVASVPPRGTVTTASPGPSGPQPAVSPEDEIAWGWPAPGNTQVLAGFDEVKNKGLDIAGKAGDPVLAAADGRVVYAGAGLRGYGNLIILKHNNTYLTAYAHNQTLLVKEDQSVRKGQKIAEMGSSDTDRVKLHFEIRRQGKPVDPARLLQR
jgi:lipoprotein NlpD